MGYGGSGATRHVDAGIELTVSGMKRIAAAGPLEIPVLNMARSQTKTFLIVSAAGEISLTHEDLALLPDGVYLAPCATRDFSILSSDPYRQATAEIPSVGRRIRFEDGRTATLLGDGRSMNLFEADAIPNQGYDAFRAGILIAAKRLCADPESLPRGLQEAAADEAITTSRLFEAYYNRYLAHTRYRPRDKLLSARFHD